jgi:hypothetical protein
MKRRCTLGFLLLGMSLQGLQRRQPVALIARGFDLRRRT